jgi:hypothetical protein
MRDLSSLLPPFYRKGLLGVWYCNLRNPVKATSLGHLRDPEARPQYKASSISFKHFNGQASGDHLGTKARRMEGGRSHLERQQQ